jgi:putative phosphoribosyl transferase
MFLNRKDAGHQLAELVASRLADLPGPLRLAGGVVLGLPRGGIPVAAMVADALGLSLDVLVVRKVGVPWQPELALGAVGESGAVVLNDGLVSAIGLSRDELEALVDKASHEVEAVLEEVRPAAGPLDLTGRVVIVVDDGVATGATARAAASVLRAREAGSAIFATPVAAPSTCVSLRSCFDDVICLRTPSRFGSVGRYYQEFTQVTIAEVRGLLAGRRLES